MRNDEIFASLDSLAYVQGKPRTSAILKQVFSDFRVDEQLGFRPRGSGDHLFVRLRKVDLGTTDVARLLAQHTGINQRDVGYSGMKDRRGECSQWFSLKTHAGSAERAVLGLESERLQILHVQRNDRKLRIGSHKANEFRLLLRDCEGERELFEQRLQHIAEAGMPNYFGPQRFGRDMSNLQQVLEMFAAADAGARMRGGQRRHGMLLSAARAYLFNQILSNRVSAGNWNSYVRGDVLNLDGTERCFAVALDEWDEQLERRLQELDIHPTGLLPGQFKAQDKYLTVGEAADIEDAVCQKYPQLVSGLQKQGVQAGRRPLRCTVREVRWNWPTEKQLELCFTLPRGAYATSLLRELCVLKEAEGNNTVESR